MTQRKPGVLAAMIALAALLNPAAAETVKVGLAKDGGGGSAPFFIAIDKGYFTAEGLTVEPVFFDASGPIAAAVVSGAVDFGSTGVTASLYNLAGQGALKIIGGMVRQMPGFRAMAVLANPRAYAAGLRTVHDLGGHTVGITSLGNGANYSIALIEEKFRIDPKTVRLVQLQSNANVVSATEGGRVDAASAPILTFAQAVASGQSKILAFVGDVTPWQSAVVFTGTKAADERGALVNRFLRALQMGERDYHDAFTGPDGGRHDEAMAPEILGIISKHFDEPASVVREEISYCDREGRLDVRDIAHQIDWMRSQGMVKEGFDAASVIDERYARPLPR